MNKIFLVTSPSDKVKEYFNCRQSAIDFIIDEFSMAVCFRTDNEGEKLAEYLLTHDETPNQYPYKYSITSIDVMTDYDKPKSIYMVKVDCVKSCMQVGGEYLYNNYEDAKEHFDSLVNEDIKNNSNNSNTESGMNPTFYDRWFTTEGYCVDHCNISLIEFVEENGELKKKCQI